VLNARATAPQRRRYRPENADATARMEILNSWVWLI